MDLKSFISVFEPMVDNSINPLGIDNVNPTFSWKLNSQIRCQVQSAYRIVIALSIEALDSNRGEVLDTGKVYSDQTIGIKLDFTLISACRYYWKVMVWDGEDRQSDWSSKAWFETGLLESSDWQAEWISGNSDYNPFNGVSWIWHKGPAVPNKSAYFRKIFYIEDKSQVAQVLFDGTADSRFEFYLNSSTVVVTNYAWNQRWTTPFNYIDITDKVVSGENCLGCEVIGNTEGYGSLIGKLRISYYDGSCEVIETDNSWKTSEKVKEGWKTSSYGDSEWDNAEIVASYGDSPWDKPENRCKPAPLLRKEFKLDKGATKARIYICGLGYFDLRINGMVVGENVLKPNYTNYNKRVEYLTYDVTEMLQVGDNCIAVELGRGYYSYMKDWIGNGDWCDEPKLLLRLDVEFPDRTKSTVVSDSSWQTTDGPTLDNNIFYGDKYDARNEKDGWDRAGYVSTAWKTVKIINAPRGELRSINIPAIEIVELIHPIAITNPKPMIFVYDMGKITSGWAKITLEALRGTSVKISYGEKLTDGGIIDIWKTGGDMQFWEITQTDIYVCKGSITESFEPKFSYKGYRYIQITGLMVPCTIEGKVLHNNVESIGSFNCSNDLLNSIHRNMCNSLLGNFHSIPTDTPMHEKRGWTADGQVIAESAMMNFNMVNFFKKWVQDMADTQSPTGEISHTCPGPVCYAPAPEWMCAYVLIPWYLYLYYNDTETMTEHYEGMKKYIQYEESCLTDFTSHDMHYADWCGPGFLKAPEGSLITATSYVYYSSKLMISMAELTGHHGDIDYYTTLCQSIEKKLNTDFYDSGENVYHTEIQTDFRQTSNVLPIAFGIIPEDRKPYVIENLEHNIMITNEGHLNAGCFGVKYLAPVLTENGRGEVAYTIATQRTYPSWGFCIENGATSGWEGWDMSVRSYNHYFLGTIDDWFYKHLAGIKPEAPGYKLINIKPFMPNSLKSAGGEIKTISGLVACEWEKNLHGFKMKVTIPVNTNGIVHIPHSATQNISEGGRELSTCDEITYIGCDNQYTVVKLGSGTYIFEVI